MIAECGSCNTGHILDEDRAELEEDEELARALFTAEAMEEAREEALDSLYTEHAETG